MSRKAIYAFGTCKKEGTIIDKWMKTFTYLKSNKFLLIKPLLLKKKYEFTIYVSLNMNGSIWGKMLTLQQKIFFNLILSKNYRYIFQSDIANFLSYNVIWKHNHSANLKFQLSIHYPSPEIHFQAINNLEQKQTDLIVFA